MYPFDEVRIAEDRFEDHLAPIALHLRVAFQRVGEVGGLGRDAAVELHEVAEFVLERSPLFVFGGVDRLHTFAELRDVVLERFEQQVERCFVRLAESARLLAQNVVRQIAELRAQQLFGFLAFGLFGRHALLGRGEPCSGRCGRCLCLGALFAQPLCLVLKRGEPHAQSGRLRLRGRTLFGGEAQLLGPALLGCAESRLRCGFFRLRALFGASLTPHFRCQHSRQQKQHDDCNDDSRIHTDKDTNKSRAKANLFDFAEREYLRHSQRYE